MRIRGRGEKVEKAFFGREKEGQSGVPAAPVRSPVAWRASLHGQSELVLMQVRRN